MAKICVIDDQELLRDSLRATLRREDHEVETYADPPAALRAMAETDFDLVLTDWNMPGLSGLEVIQEIRAKDKDIPIVMVTTEAEKSRVVEAIQAGVTDYLVKPFTAETLREKIEKIGC